MSSLESDSRYKLMESGITHNGYVAPPWIENEGRYFNEEGIFNPDAYDPSAPYKIQGKSFRLASNPDKEFEDPFDLDNLRFLEKHKIENLLKKLEGLAAEIADTGSTKEVVAMIGTGGTIAMTFVNGEEKPTLDPGYLLRYAGGALDERFSVSSTQYPTPIDSSKQEFDYEADLAIAMSWIWKNMSDQLKECFAGFAIPHGTDTLGGGSNSTSMMLGPNCPFSVGFVGAQKTTQHLYSDVGTNIRGLFDTLHTLKRQKKVARFVYMGGTEGGAFHPAGVIKIDDRHANAFRTPIHERLINASDFGLGGMIDRFGRRYMETLDREGAQKAFQPIILRGYAPVIDLTPKLGTNPALYYQQISTNESAIAVLLTTFGSYTVNPKVRKAITLAAQAKGKIVLGANPFPGGSTNHNYGPAKELRENGAYAVGTLPDATMIKVFLAHSVFGNNLPLLVQFLIENNFIGEQNPGEWMLNSEDGVVTPELDTSVSSMPRFGAPDAFFQKVKA